MRRLGPETVKIDFFCLKLSKAHDLIARTATKSVAFIHRSNNQQAR